MVSFLLAVQRLIAYAKVASGSSGVSPRVAVFVPLEWTKNRVPVVNDESSIAVADAVIRLTVIVVRAIS